jgi:hypothetical protein
VDFGWPDSLIGRTRVLDNRGESGQRNGLVGEVTHRTATGQHIVHGSGWPRHRHEPLLRLDGSAVTQLEQVQDIVRQLAGRR